MLWIHGGPFVSNNAWSWRWNPWVAVAHGWAVVLPDPAPSTGYGQSCIHRAWPYLADVVWREAEAVLDAALERPGLDGSRLALLGGSFGGFMTNWIAGHTERFGAIVTHAGLWALDQQHATTDNAEFKTGVFGRLHDHPDWYAAYSPHNCVDKIRTPMLVVHGNRDYRVPVSEALRLWWDLVNLWPGDPEQMPHRFLQFPGENHWVLRPGNAQVWYETVLGFCAQHVLGQTWARSDLL
jgi:dipeptidyl aminopeptidase/acylaminoacyl peptidase